MQNILITNNPVKEEYSYSEHLIGDWNLYVNPETIEQDDGKIIVTVIDDEGEDETEVSAERFQWWWDASRDPLKLLVAILAPDLISSDFNMYIHTGGNTGWFLLSVIIRDVYRCEFNYIGLRVYDDVLKSFSGHPLDKNVATSDIYANNVSLTLAYQLGAGIGLLEYGTGLKDAWLTPFGQVFALAVRMYLSSLGEE